MAKIGVRFTEAGLIYYYEKPKEIQVGDYVIAPVQKCDQFGEVVLIKEEESEEELPQIKRVATQSDIAKMKQNQEDARQAMEITKRRIEVHGLEMKLIEIQYSFERTKMLFYFTADGRIDFRELVKDLASIFKTRIELRQVGVRDEAKLLGGLGPCGRPLCCHQFLGDFMPVSIKMAKDQHLSLNPTKISGVCGRLMCCLQYEDDVYEEAKRQLPDIGKKVITPDGPGWVVGLNILQEIVQVRLLDKEVPLDYPGNEVEQKDWEEKEHG